MNAPTPPAEPPSRPDLAAHVAEGLEQAERPGTATATIFTAPPGLSLAVDIDPDDYDWFQR